METSKEEIIQTIEQLSDFLRKNNNLLPDQTLQLMKDMYGCCSMLSTMDAQIGCKYFISTMIPFLKTCIKCATNNNDIIKEYYDLLKKSYGRAGERSLEHFIVYYEWDWSQEDKLLENRYEALAPYVYYLNKIPFDNKLEYVLASYPPSYGKCIDENSYILTPNGRKQAKELQIGDYVYSEKNNKLCQQKIINKWQSRKKQVKITTRSGKTITISPEHRMLTSNGYKQAKDITTNDYLKTLLKPINGEQTINEDELIFVTCMIFDGYCKTNKLSFTKEDNEITHVFLQTCKNLGITYISHTKPNGKASSYCLRKKVAYELLKRYGLIDHTSKTKRLPQQFWNLSLEQKYKIIGVMFATDGYISKTGDIGITLANEKLIDDIQLFLNTVGIFSIKNYKKTGKFDAWRLRIPKDYFLKLRPNCYFYQKQKNAENVKESQMYKRGNLCIKYPYEYLKTANITKNDYYDYHLDRKQDLNETTFNRLANKYKDLKQYIYEDFILEQITKIEYDENEIAMIDFEIEETHNFLLDGCVSHNSRVLCYYEAWRLGVQNKGCFLRISYSDMLVKGFSRSVIDIIKSPEYGFVFPEMDFAKNPKLFAKATDEEWRLQTAGLLQSYMARSRDGQINGTRASLSIDIDDMIKDDKEALNMELHDENWIKWVNVIQSRKTLGKKIGYIIVGTKWSPYDLICRIEDDLRSQCEFVKDKKFKYCEVSTDGRCVLINVPALDYETDESTCPKVVTTEELRDIRRKNTPYYFSSVYQQRPIPPEGLDFDWSHLQTYDTKPVFNKDYEYTFATLDPARKGKNFVSMPIHAHIEDKYPLVDVLFEKKAMTDLYDDIVAKIIENKTIKLVLENNIDTSLKTLLDQKLKEKRYFICEIIEHYSLAKKEQRIKDQQGIIRHNVVFPDKTIIEPNSPMGRFMTQLTSFSFEFANKYDDAIDSEAMFAHQIILDKSNGMESEVLDRKKIGI